MRATLFAAAWLAPVAIGSAIPSFEAFSPAQSFDRRQETDLQALGGKILQSDVYAGVAAINQQLYQATKAQDQWKKCNPLNIVVRREWYV